MKESKRLYTYLCWEDKKENVKILLLILRKRRLILADLKSFAAFKKQTFRESLNP